MGVQWVMSRRDLYCDKAAADLTDSDVMGNFPAFV